MAFNRPSWSNFPLPSITREHHDKVHVWWITSLKHEVVMTDSFRTTGDSIMDNMNGHQGEQVSVPVLKKIIITAAGHVCFRHYDNKCSLWHDAKASPWNSLWKWHSKGGKLWWTKKIVLKITKLPKITASYKKNINAFWRVLVFLFFALFKDFSFLDDWMKTSFYLWLNWIKITSKHFKNTSASLNNNFLTKEKQNHHDTALTRHSINSLKRLEIWRFFVNLAEKVDI